MSRISTTTRKVLELNPVLMLTMYSLLVFSVFVIESAARHQGLGGKWFADRQILWIGIGSIIYFITAFIDYKWLKWLSIPMYLVALVLMVVVAWGGSSVHQIELGGILFQPTQFMVGAGILLAALLLEQLPQWREWFGHPIVKLFTVFVVCGLPFLLVVKSGDIGSALVWIPLILVYLFMGGIPYRYLLVILFSILILLPPVYYVVMPSVSVRATNRIEQYIAMIRNNGEVEYNDANYAIHYVTTAIGKAGWKGVGLNNQELAGQAGAIHANGFIPYDTAHNDYIFGVIGEELGYRGGGLLLSVYLLLIVGCLLVGIFSKDLFGLLTCYGVGTLFFAHVFENVGMCIRVMPITGIPLPLVSYSGSFTLICMLMLGVVQSIWIHRMPDSLTEQDRQKVRMLNL